MNIHCCDAMRSQLQFACELHASPFECTDALVTYSPKFNEYGLIVHDGGCSTIGISFCPWCGERFPESLRGRWFAELESHGYDDPLAEGDIPDRYKTDAWWRQVS